MVAQKERAEEREEARDLRVKGNAEMRSREIEEAG